MDRIRGCVHQMHSLEFAIVQERTERSMDEVRRCLIEMHFLRFSIARQRAQQKSTQKTDTQMAAARATKTLRWLEKTLVTWKARQEVNPDEISQLQTILREID